MAPGAARTRISVTILRARVEHDHPPTAPPAPEQPGEQRGPLPRRARPVLPGPVGLEPLLIGPEPVPGDVRRQSVADQHQAILGPADRLPGGRTARALAARVDGPMAEPV